MQEEHSFNPQITELEKKHLEGVQLSPGDVNIANAALASPNLIERIIAAEALLRSSTPDFLSDKAFETLRSLCDPLVRGDKNFEPRLAWSLSLIPTKYLLRVEEFENFAFRLIEKGDTPSKINVIQVLERFACHGNEKAKTFLTVSLGDENEYVRRNAASSLRRIQHD